MPVPDGPVLSVDFAQQAVVLRARLVALREDALRTEGAINLCEQIIAAFAAGRAKAPAKPSEETPAT